MKRILIAMLVLVMCLSLAVPAMAQQNLPRVVDQADLLDVLEEAALLSKLDAISMKQGMDVVVVTADTLNGQSTRDYADDFYDDTGYAPDGILLLVSMEDRDWWITTAGDGIDAFTDNDIESLGEAFVPYLSDGDYAGAFDVYADTCDEMITQAKLGTSYAPNGLTTEPASFVEKLTATFVNGFKNFVICLVIGFVFALIVTGIMKGKLKSVRFQSGASNYVKAGSLNVTHRQDLFLYRDVKRTPRPKSTTTHTSSSGRSHGGGGGKF